MVEDDSPAQVEQFPGFLPWRRSVRWLSPQEVAIRPLVGRLTFLGGGANWGSRFRFGFLEIPQEDGRLLAWEMGIL